MFVRARENIMKDEEVNLRYFNKEDKKSIYEKQWGFNFNCKKCVLNKKIFLNLTKQIDLVSSKIRNKNKTCEKTYMELISLLKLSKKSSKNLDQFLKMILKSNNRKFKIYF